MSRKTWTIEEVEFLEKNFEFMKNIDLAKKLKRSVESIRNKARRLGVTKNVEWSEDDDIYLSYFTRENDTNIHEAAEFLNRTYGTTLQRLVYLRKKGDADYIRRRWTKKEDDFIKTHYVIMPAMNVAIRLNRSINSVRSRAVFLGVNKCTKIKNFDEKIKKMLSEGYYLVEISRKLSINQTSLRNYVVRNGIEYTPMSKSVNENHYWRQLDQARYAEYLKKIKEEINHE